MDEGTRNRLLRQLARAIEIGDHAAEVMLRARLGLLEAAPKPEPPLSELELRYRHGDR